MVMNIPIPETVDGRILFEAMIDNVGRLEDSIVGRNAVIHRRPGTHRAMRLMIGDDVEVLL